MRLFDKYDYYPTVEVTAEHEIKVYADTKKQAKEATMKILAVLTKEEIRISSKDKETFKLSAWETEKMNFMSEQSGYIIIDEKQNDQCILIAGINEYVKKTTHFVKNYLENNRTEQKIIKFAEYEIKLFLNAFNSDLNEVQKELKEGNVCFEVIADQNKMLIKGINKYLHQAEKQVSRIKQTFQRKEHAISLQGMGEYLGSKTGWDFIAACENKYQVAIVVLKSEAIQSFQSTSRDMHYDIPVYEKRDVSNVKGAKLKRFDDTGEKHTSSSSYVKNEAESNTIKFSTTTVRIKKGSVERQQADAIVNTTSEQLNLNVGAVSRAILIAAGPGIQQAVEKKGTLAPGEVVETGGFNLECQSVYHSFCPYWDQGKGECEQALRKIVQTTLLMASQQGYQSIAYPAIGTGQMGVPADLAAKAMLDEFEAFSHKNPTLREIHLIIYPRDMKTYESFTGEISARVSTGIGSNFQMPYKMAGPVFAPCGPDKLKSSTGLAIALQKGDLSSTKVDVIVNTPATGLDLTRGAVSNAILQAAGLTLQDEYTQKGPLSYGQVIKTGPHNLPCHAVYHGSSPSWGSAGGYCEKILRSLVSKCLQMANKEKFTSIAFPAIGTGGMSVPGKESAKFMYEEIGNFCVRTPDAVLNQVYIIIHGTCNNAYTSFAGVMEEFASTAHLPKALPPKPALKPQSSKSDEASVRPFQHHASIPFTTIPAEKRHDVLTHGSVPYKFPGPDESIGDISICFTTESIVSQDDEAILVFSSPDLHTIYGNCGNEILTAGGEELRNECGRITKKEDVTITGGGCLKALYVVHVTPPQEGPKKYKTQWQKRIIKGLKTTNKKAIKSIAIPMLANSEAPLSILESTSILVSAVRDFSETRPKSLLSIKFVVKSNADIKIVKNEIKETSGKSEGLFAKAKKKLIGGGIRAGRSTESDGNFVIKKLEIWAKDGLAIDGVIEELKDLYHREYREETISFDNLKNLKPMQKDNIIKMEDRYPVKIIMRGQEIEIRGAAKDVLVVKDKINTRLASIKAKEDEEVTALLLENKVQWSYQIVGIDCNFQPFEKIANSLIEKAYVLGHDNVVLDIQSGQVIIDLEAMVCRGNEYDSAIIRQTLAKGADAMVLPPNWAAMEDDAQMKMVELSPGCQEYKSVENEVKATADGHITNIKMIKRMQNKALYRKFLAHTQEMETRNNSLTDLRTLWHGTSGKSVESISRYGFNRSYCGRNATVYGQGVYFARKSAYSARDTYSPPESSGNKHIIMAKVLLGYFTDVTNRTLRVPPEREGKILYDTIVNDMNDPSVFVIFNDSQAYPEYFITFT